MHSRNYILPLIPLMCLVAHAQESPPIEAQKYHEALLKHPNNPTVFSRFYDAWIDAQSIESLETFLEKRAETHGGIDYVILARYQLHRGQDPNALVSLNKAIENLPNDPALLMERANILMRSTDFVAARKDLDAISKLGNEALSIEASKLIGKSYLREGDPEAAIKAWEKILTNHPKNEDLLEDLVELASSSEQPEQALKYSEQLIAASTDPYKKALRLIRRGELLAKSGENDKAIALWSETLSQTGEGSWLEREILAYIEQSFRRLDRIDLLSTKFEELATAHPRRLLIHRELAKLEATSGNIDSAIGRFREVLRRSPGETELREEFIRLLITSERFDDASAEIGKMLSSTPNNPELHLRLAELAFQKLQLNPALDKKATSAEIQKSLEKAREFLDPTEASGLRIANLMILYGLEENGETLLKQLSTKPDASTAPAEALAAEYTRTKRPTKSLEILTELTKSPDPETVLRAANAMAPLSKAETPFNILLSRLPDFPNNNPYIAALIQASLAAKKPADAIPSALKLVRSSKLSSEIQDATKLASAVITSAEKAPEIITELSKIETRSTPEICLLAALLEIQEDHEKSDALFANTTEPTLLRFHSSLLSVRGDFKAAIASLNRLAETSADNSASYFKELSDLQLRSGDSAAALKTIELWKIAAPTDKTPWTIASRLLRESGKYAEAIETTRRALSRFNTDEDLAASLADLYQETGVPIEAERIFWKLYDQAPDTNSQSRWAARLATLANSNGQTEELKEKFLQRSRSNNQSIGPILALVELARVTNNQESLLEYLYQALRIKPKDIDIRLQVASTEKQAGNLEKQMAILNEGMDQDPTGRIRTSLAQAFIDQGHVIKGMHMLRALNGEGASDPRFIETSANSIASAGLVAEAIQYLEESLPKNRDWRSRFLLADLLQNDGREFEATSILLSLMEAKDEIPGLMPNQNFERIQQNGESPEYYFQSLMNVVAQEIYRARNSNRSSGNQQQALPSSIEELHFRSKILLAFIANLGNPVLKDKITAANIKELTLIADIIDCYSENGIDYLALLEKHPTNNDLIKMVVQQGRLRDPNTGENYTIQKTATIYKILLDTPNLDQEIRTKIILSMLQSDPKNDATWDRFFKLIDESFKPQENSNHQQIHYQLHNLIATQRAEIPSKHFPKIKEILLKNNGGSSQEIPILFLLGEIDPWIIAVNKLIADHQKQLADQLKAQKQHNVTKINAIDHYGFYPQIPQIRNLPLTSINIYYLQNISSEKFNINERGVQGGIESKDLIKHLDRFESPVLRAWIAIKANDQKAIQKTLSVKPSEIEANDFTILKLWLDIEDKRYPEACRSLLKLSNDPSTHPHHSHWAKTSFLAIVSEIPADKRSEFLPVAREIINSYSPPATATSQSRNNGSYPALLQISKKLGFEDLVVKFTSPANAQNPQRQKPRPPSKVNIGSPSTIASNNTNSSQSKKRPVTPIERFEQFSSEGKHLAAAHELLNHAQTQKKQGYDLSYIFSNTKMSEEVRKEIISISDPGKNPSLNKRLAFAEICLALKAKDEALTILRALAAERPFDSNIKIQLALNLPEQEIDTAANLIKQSANSPEFYNILNSNNQRIHLARNNATTFHYFSLITKFLEISDPEKFEYRAFNEINDHIYYFLTGNNLISIPSLIGNTDQKNETPEILKHREISRRLTSAMLRNPLLAESGFRYIRAAKWIEDPIKIDELARTVILLETQQNKSRYNSSNLPEFSAASWICYRLNESKSHNEIIPADFLASIEKNDPELASLLRSFSSIKTTKDIATFWDSSVMQDDNYQTSRSVIQLAVLEKIANIPGANDFFISRIKALSQNQIFNSRSNRTGEYNHIPLIRAALTSCKNQSESTVNNLCKAIVNTVYGENFNFSITNGDTNTQDYQLLSGASSIIDSLLNNQSLDPVTAIRVFQAFDSHRVPLQNHYWVQSIFQRSEITDHKVAIEFLDSMGLLKDTQEWKPIACSTITNQYDQTTGTSTFSITRNLLNETITQSFNYRMRNPEFVTLLEQRKPQTFGSLVTAAMLSNDSTQRERLMLSAFKHAAPQLAKASPKQLEDFNLLVSYLPPEAITILPPKLQIKAKERNDQIVATILKNIDQQFKQIDANPNQDPFNAVDSYILQLAPYDLDKAAEIFLRAHSVFKTNIAYFTGNQTNLHQTYFSSILSSFSSDRKIRPESAIKFYRAVLSSPNGSEFGYTSRDYGASHLNILGSQLYSRLNSSIHKNTHHSLRPWLIANQLPEECQNDALAATLCYTLHQQNSGPSIAELIPILEKTEGLSEKSREMIISCAHITNLRNLTPENRTASAQHLSKLLNDPSFTPNTRIQIALSALSSIEILTLPAVAEIYSEIFTDLSKQDQSMVNSLVINSLAAVSNTELTAESIPHLKKISEAFWDNANSPKSGGHPTISKEQAANLFQLAIKSGDAKSSKRLFPIVQPSLIGKLSSIIPLISGGHYEFATALIPDDHTPFEAHNQLPRYTPELHQKIIALRQSDINPTRLLKLECALLKLQTPDGNHATPSFTAERREYLTKLIAKNPIAASTTQIEILSALATSTDPSNITFAAEISTLSETIDPNETINEMVKSTSVNPTSTLRWTILCKAASTRLCQGDPAPTISLINSITKSTGSAPNAAGAAQIQLLTYLLPATCFAIADNQNTAFSALIDPLSDLVVACVNTDNYDFSTTSEILTLCEFISTWKDRPDTLSKTIARLKNNKDKFEQEFAFPRRFPWLSSRYFKINDHGGSSPELTKAYINFLSAILSHPNMSDLLPGHYYLLDVNFANKGMEKEIIELANGPEDTFTPGGRAITAYHRAMDARKNKRYPEIEKNLREGLSHIPEGDAWCHFRGITKMFIVNYILTDPSRLNEARPIFETILPKEVSQGHNDFYQSVRNKLPALKEAEEE